MNGSVINGSRQIRILTAAGAPAAELTSVRIRYRQAMRLPASCDENPLPLAPPLPEDPVDEESRDEHTPRRSETPAATIPAQTDFATVADSAPSEDTRDDPNTTVLGRIARALCRQQRSGFVIDHLANRVAEFCNAPSIMAGGPWEIRLPIDPSVLPDTSLWLRLAARQLNLRFESLDVLSRQLLRDNKQTLAEKLAAALRDKYDIDIEVW